MVVEVGWVIVAQPPHRGPGGGLHQPGVPHHAPSLIQEEEEEKGPGEKGVGGQGIEAQGPEGQEGGKGGREIHSSLPYHTSAGLKTNAVAFLFVWRCFK